MDIAFAAYSLSGLGKINVILGKNGCGKSTLLRALDVAKRSAVSVRYITPERGGTLLRDGNIETNMANSGWIEQVRGKNRFEQFRQASTAEFRKLETLVLRKIEKDPKFRTDADYSFDTTVGEINALLENVEIVRSADGAFQVRNRGTQDWRQVDSLSSGETELISLGIEVLSFAFGTENEQYAEKENWLLFDEPDVHLHPDLQYRLMRLLVNASGNRSFRTVISTHSTAVVSALSELTDVQIAFMGHQQKNLVFEPASAALKAVMPIFGSHPLSNVFNARPILLVEGEDDERIWQQVSRSSRGQVRLWPCAAGDIQSLNEHEEKARSILGAVYENATAFSLRDRDDDPYEIDDLPPVVRARLNCRSAENLILSDDVLSHLETDWATLQGRLESWLTQNEGHPQFQALVGFRDTGWNRREADLKPLRNILMAQAGSQKPWEVAVGQAIAALKNAAGAGKNSLTDFLGPKLVEALNLKPPGRMRSITFAHGGYRGSRPTP